MDAMEPLDPDQPVVVPIDGELDLHTFDPREVADLLADYLGECQRLGILEVRVIHGKGRGILRERVHVVLERLDLVESYGPAGPEAGGWGATVVNLRPAA